LAQNQLSCFWNEPKVSAGYRAAVSLHSHTNHSKESLRFVLEFAQKRPLLRWALERQSRRSTLPVDWVRAYWTPPLVPKLAFEVERNQIEQVLALAALVSLTDHDIISAPTLLRVLEQTGRIPLSLEWSVPFEGAIFHLGVHNLPTKCAQSIVADLGAYTSHRSDFQLGELLAMLHQFPEVLLIFNHPLWDLSDVGAQRYEHVLGRFLTGNVRFLHAFELNATRSQKENNNVIELAGRWRRLLISGGDRHGCEPSGALNLTHAESFSEFVHEIRIEQRSHVLFMPQYAEPLGVRTAQTVLDVIRDYPEYSAGCRRWDDRIFHPDQSPAGEQQISALWEAPPAFIERIFSVMRVLENASVRRAFGQILRNEISFDSPSDIGYEAAS
jgi:hypothetical protein